MLTTDEINIRDPFVLVHEGKYYLYGTRGETCWGPATGFDVYIGDDLKNWEGPVPCFENDGTFWADRNYWAPEVHEWNGRFYMFASFKADGVCRGTAILVSDTPRGPFVPHSDGPVTPREWECLDGTFYVSRDGRPYMVFSHEWVQAVNGEIYAMPLNDTLSAPAGEPKLLFKAADAPWVVGTKHEDGSVTYVTDGPFLYRTKDGTLLCLWASFGREGYAEGVAVSASGEIDGRFGQAEPLFEKDGGHGMVFRALDGQLYMTLHSPNTHLMERPRFYPLEDTGSRLCMTAGRQD